MTSEPTVFIVDDDRAMLDFISFQINSIGLKTKTFICADDYLRQFDPQIPGCLILDVRMPDTGGLEVQETLSQMPLCPPIVFVTGGAEVPPAVQAMRYGAVDFLQKPFDKITLTEAIQRAIAKDVTNRARIAREKELADRFAQLSTAEHDVLQLVIRGEPNKKIAASLDIGIRTVEDRRARIMQKLGIDTAADLIRLAIEAGLRTDE